MHRVRVFLLLGILITPPALAETAQNVTLWEVSGHRNSVFLLGSIHLLRPQDYPLPTAINAAYDEAEVLIMEIDMDDMDPLAAQVAFTTHGVLKDETTLTSIMGPELYRRASTAADAIDIPLEMLDKTEPWYAAITVEIMMLSRMGFDPTLGVEMHMMNKAVRDQKPIEGFETVEEQVAFLDGMSMQAQREMLLATLEDGARLRESMDQLIDAWRIGDVEFLEKGMLDEMAEHAELEKVLVTDRNNRWVTHIEELLDDDDDYLIIVGALHLIGPNGVPRLLDAAGYDVLQLSESPAVR